MKNKYLLSLLIIIAFICISSFNAYAQIDSVNKIDEVKVISLKSIPAIIPSQIVQAKDFKKFSAYNVADAIRNFTGVNVKDYGGIGGLKTVSVRSLGASHTAVLFDGVMMTDAHNGQIDLGKISLDNIERITLFNAQPDEILQPARSYASASVISLKTVRPSFDSLKNYKLGAGMVTGSFGLVNPVLQWQQKINSSWSYKINSSWQKANGKYKYKLDGYGSDTLAIRNNADIEAFSLDAAVYGSFAKANRFFIRANYYNSERGLPGAVISYNPFSTQRLWNKDFFVQASFQQQLKERWKLKLSHKTSKNFTRYLDPEFLNQQGRLDQEYKQYEIYNSVSSDYQLNKTFSFNYAADLSFVSLKTNLPQYSYPERLSLLQVLGTSINYRKWKAKLNYLNTYITERVKLGASAPSRSVFTPSFLVSYQPSDQSDFLIRAFYKEIFRYPTFSDLYYTNYGNRTLNPEFIRQYNVGSVYGKAFGSRLSYFSLNIDAYFNTIKDRIIATPNKDLFLWTVRNIGAVDIYGVDAALKANYEITQKWDAILSANYTYQLALDVSNPQAQVYNHQLPYTPEHTLNANIGFKKHHLGLYYNHLFSSGRYYLSENSPEYFVPGFSISDISAVRDFKINKNTFTASVEVNNLFNKPYSLIRSFPMPGTAVRFSLKITL